MRFGKLGLVFMFILLLSFAVQAITKDEALKAIGDAEKDIIEMNNSGFSVDYVNDKLSEARKAVERAEFAMLIENNDQSEIGRKAKAALEGLDYEGFSYDDVIVFTEEIGLRKEKAYLISDSLRALELKIRSYEEEGISVSEEESMLSEAKTSFSKERYGEAERLLDGISSKLDEKKGEIAATKAILNTGKNFVQDNLIELGISVFVLVIISLFGGMIIRKKRRKRRLDNLYKESEALVQLIKKAQIERFRNASISDMVYKIRVDKYNERLDAVKREIPVMESMLKKK